jgi:hypothetical protein
MKKIIYLLLLVLLSCEEQETEYEIISFYSWDVTENPVRILENPINKDDVILIKAVMLADLDSNSYLKEIDSFNEEICENNGEIILEDDMIKLSVNRFGIFNTSDFDNPDQQRGYVIIEYE